MFSEGADSELHREGHVRACLLEDSRVGRRPSSTLDSPLLGRSGRGAAIVRV